MGKFNDAIIENEDMGYLYGKYNSDRPRQVQELALLGASLAQIAAVMCVTVNTINNWKKNHKEFAVALAMGEMPADGAVAASLYKCAIGYEYEEEVTKMVDGIPTTITIKKRKLPDPWSAAKWLSMRQKENWSASPKGLGEGGTTNIQINQFDLSKVSTEEMQLLKQIGIKQLKPGVDSGAE